MREMKDSGIYYLGKIPKEWKICKYKCFSKSRMGETILANDTIEKGIPIYSATQEDKIFGYVESASIILKKGDIVIPARGNSIGCATIIKQEVATCTQTTICSYNIKNINNKYYYYSILALKDEWFKFDGSAIPQITVEQVKNNKLTIPKIEEQTRIANFLDKKVTEIDKIIEKTKQTIEDYKKYKQSIITKAVTIGIREKVQIKQSKVEWIKEIPKNWNIYKTKEFFEFIKGLPITKADLIEKGEKVISYGQIHSKSNNGVEIKEELIRYVSEEYIKTNKQSIAKKDEFIFADTSEDLKGCGNCVYIDKETEVFAGYHTIILRPKNKQNIKYLAYLFLTDCWRSQIRSRVSGIKLFSITQKILKETTIILPKKEEQEEIVKYLDEKCEQIDEIIKNKEKTIQDLEKYRKSLIYEYVTGKKEIKEQ